MEVYEWIKGKGEGVLERKEDKDEVKKMKDGRKYEGRSREWW